MFIFISLLRQIEICRLIKHVQTQKKLSGTPAPEKEKKTLNLKNKELFDWLVSLEQLTLHLRFDGTILKKNTHSTRGLPGPGPQHHFNIISKGEAKKEKRMWEMYRWKMMWFFYFHHSNPAIFLSFVLFFNFPAIEHQSLFFWIEYVK